MKESELLGDRILRIKTQGVTDILYRSSTGHAFVSETTEMGSGEDWRWRAQVFLNDFAKDIEEGRKQPLSFYGRSPQYLEDYLGLLSARVQKPVFIDLEDFEAEALPEINEGIATDTDPDLEMCAGCGLPMGDGGEDRCSCVHHEPSYQPSGTFF